MFGWDPWATMPGGSQSALADGGCGWEPERTTGKAVAASSNLTVADTGFLDCPICFLPLKPPIFQCPVAHVVCSLCWEELKDARKCHLCRVAMARGYRRCHAMECAVDSVRAPCPRAPYGCDATPAYHARVDHLLECPHGPCHCPAGDACGFAGSTAALLQHAVGAHGWAYAGAATTQRPVVSGGGRLDLGSSTSCRVSLRDGFNFLVATDEHGGELLFLLNVVRQPFGRAVSVVCVRPRSAPAREIQLMLRYQYQLLDDPLLNHDQKTEFRVACSDLSDGLHDPNRSCQLVVPKCAYGDDQAAEMTVDVRMIATK